MYVKEHLRPRLVTIFRNMTVTVQIGDERMRTYIIGAYCPSNDKFVIKSLKNEVKNILNNYVNGKIVLTGDFNNYNSKKESKSGMKSTKIFKIYLILMITKISLAN